MGGPVSIEGRLADKVTLVVGGGSTGDEPGTGSATARLFARQGARVAVMGRTSEHTNKTVGSVADDGGAAIAVLGDATLPADCARAVDAVIDTFGQLDVVVNNLGYAPRVPLMELEDDEWNRTFDVNLKAVVLMTRAALPHLRKSSGPSVINIGSIGGVRGGGAGAYGVSKGGLVALTRALASELGPDGIRVNCIVPGHLHTPMASNAMGERLRDARRQVSLLGVEGTGWDVGWTAVFLASDESRYITAASVPVDGGASEELPLSAILRMGLV